MIFSIQFLGFWWNLRTKIHPRSLTASLPLEKWWERKTILSYWVSVTFQGLLLLNFGRVMNQQQKSSPNNRQNHHLTITYNHHLTENQRKCAKSFPNKAHFLDHPTISWCVFKSSNSTGPWTFDCPPSGNNTPMMPPGARPNSPYSERPQ